MRKGTIAMIIFGIVAAASSATAGYRYYTIRHIDDRLDKLYAKEDEINEAMNAADEKYAAAMESAAGPYDAASSELDKTWTRYNDLQSYSDDLNDLINNYEDPEESSEESLLPQRRAFRKLHL